MYDPDYFSLFFKYVLNPRGDNDDDPWKTWRIDPNAPVDAKKHFNAFIEGRREAERRGIQF